MADGNGYIWFSHYLARVLVDGETSGGDFAMVEMRSGNEGVSSPHGIEYLGPPGTMP